MCTKVLRLILPLVFLSLPLLAQPRARGVDGFRSEVRLQGYQFGNFFQASDAALEQDVRAAGLEYRGAWRPAGRPTDFYAHASYLRYTSLDRDDSYGGRIGVFHADRRQEFNVYLDQAENRAAFDVGDVTALASITTLAGSYGFRITPTWQIGAEAQRERQRFDVTTGRDNDYTSYGASLRYRGFGRGFSPEVGLMRGSRDVDDARESYDEDTWFARVIMAPTDKTYISVRYRDRARDYQTPQLTAGNFGRVDDRHQWTANFVYQFTQTVGASVYYAREDVASSRPGRDFDANLLVVGLHLGF